VGVFALLALVVAGLGLFGLSAFTVAQRTREIGIRKVMGASLAGILGLLSRYFLKRVLLGILIAIPVAWYAMHQWLSGFAFRIAIRPHTFLLAGGIALLVVACTVGYQSLKAARANPVQALRNE
jgi:putative ABC transport system permease protein